MTFVEWTLFLCSTHTDGAGAGRGVDLTKKTANAGESVPGGHQFGHGGRRGVYIY